VMGYAKGLQDRASRNDSRGTYYRAVHNVMVVGVA
jgi:hypothetical protein